MQKVYLFFILLFPTVIFCQQYFVTTILDSSNVNVSDALALDRHGNLYGSDWNGNAVYKLSPSGKTSMFASGFNTPNGLAFNSKDQLYVVDNQANRIYKLDKNGTFLDTIFVNSPSGIIKSLDSDTMIFTRYIGNRISKLAPNGTIIPWHQGTPLNGPVGLCYDDSAQLYVGNFEDREIHRLHDDSIEYIATIPGPNIGRGFLGFITYGNGRIYGTSMDVDRIYSVHPGYADSLDWFCGYGRGSVDGHVSLAKFNRPNGILASKTGDTLYVSDFGTGNVRMIHPFIFNGMETHNRLTVSAIPNPFEDHLVLHSEFNLQGAHFFLFDVHGRLVLKKKNLYGNRIPLDLSHLAPGIFTGIVQGKKGNGIIRLSKK